MRSFHGRFPPVSVPAGYRLGLMLVLLLLLANVAVYLGLIAVVSWFMVHGVGALQDGYLSGRGTVYMGLALMGGVVLLYFLLRPLPLIFRRRPSPGIPVVRSAEPDIYAFVTTIAGLVDAPMPERIMVDCNVNASASLASFFGGRLVLRLGLPLAGGLDCRQLAGIVAHELGHFAQGAGMRTTWLVRRVEYALELAILDLDRIARSNSRAWPLRVGLLLPRFVLGLSVRGSRAMLRHMERDADRYEARVAGSETFAKTAVRLAELDQAQASLGPVRSGDVVARTLAAWRELTPAERQHARRRVQSGETRWQDTHPSDAERIALAKGEQAPGVYRCEAPATVLFRDFGRLCKAATRDLATDG
ncbi:MAG: M48 family metallopeptidase [Myxococcota bacterium]